MAIVYQYATTPYYWGSSPQNQFHPVAANVGGASSGGKITPSLQGATQDQFFAFQQFQQQQQFFQLQLQHQQPQFQLHHSLSSSSLSSDIECPNLPQKRLLSSDDMNHYEEDNIDDDNVSSDEEEEQLKLYLEPFIKQILETKASQQILYYISDCLKEYITVKSMLSKIKTICQEYQIENIYQTLIQTFIKVDGDVKMVSYMTGCGVEEGDLEFVKEIELTQNSMEIVKKKRERKRESVSRGLRSPPNKWTKDESQNLIRLVTEIGDKQWKKIAMKLGGGKTGAQCAQHWKRVLSPEIKKGSWDEDEELLLFQLVDKHGQSWKNVAMDLKTRTDIQCRYQYFKATTSRQTPWSNIELELLTKKIDQILSHSFEVTSFQQVSKHLARAKTTKIPRTALECKMKWTEICSFYQQLGRTISQQQIIQLYKADQNF